jgi:hypothetical protein
MPDYNETAPYLDLSMLYGVNDSETDAIRVKDGRGMLSPDCFFDNRVILLPPAVSALLILWNRNHNVRYVLMLLGWRAFADQVLQVRRRTPSLEQ